MAPNPELAAQQISETRAQAESYGRKGEDIKFFQGVSFIIGDTEEEARAKEQEYLEYVSAEGYAAHTALVDPDGRVYPPETPISQLQTNSARGEAEWLAKAITDREPVVADLIRHRATRQTLVGTPEQIADGLQEWKDAGVDGINVINWVIPGSFQEFADKVLPVLRERGLAKTEYQEGTLRKKLFGHDRLPESHPGAKYRGAFAPVGV
jgi:alkanesulfonate monooxygenase SsuD/methylene tetrahydromethanopterin reductase-like flavin-dependent oxidoreductase (luciferase family)